MASKRLNLGILAHVDAGKTTLTERLLHAAGVIDAVGSVDRGTTQTDTLALERRRGITIRSAVVSFAIGDTTVNLIDTPGHPDFIAEVERVLHVLDGVVLVLSAVEGVQPQTRVLMRALQRLRLPTLLFVNKVDRAGADSERVLAAVRERLTPAAAWAADDAALTELLADRDDELLAAWLDGDVPPGRLREALVAQTRQARFHPAFAGSALTGAGVPELMAGIAELLPAAERDGDGPLAAAVFKIERGESGEKVAYARLFSGTLHVRDRLLVGGVEEKVTALHVFERGGAEQRDSVAAGGIAKLRGLAGVQVGDRLGDGAAPAPAHAFAPPTHEAVVVPRDPADAARLRAALVQLAEQDPLIDLRQDDERRELSLSLYGEVQKEVVEATLALDYGLEVEFRETSTICVERPLAAGDAVEILNAEGNPFSATVGLRVEPGAEGSGVEFRLAVPNVSIPLYVYRSRETFELEMTRYVRDALQEGLRGWRVTDCVVTMTECEYSSADGPPSKRGRLSMPPDYQRLTPIVLMDALARCGTEVCEPVLRAALEVPAGSLGSVMRALGKLAASVEAPALSGPVATLEALLPATHAQQLQRQLSGLTGGEGVVETSFAGYRPVAGEAPERRRTRPDPRNRAEYLMHLARRV
ncbi:MAG TPA: translation factor GTPase family protein [Gaiellaceae bacterium]|nr:translation factor GTPase family protein [Gaiellaceae bacterium]